MAIENDIKRIADALEQLAVLAANKSEPAPAKRTAKKAAEPATAEPATAEPAPAEPAPAEPATAEPAPAKKAVTWPDISAAFYGHLSKLRQDVGMPAAKALASEFAAKYTQGQAVTESTLPKESFEAFYAELKEVIG